MRERDIKDLIRGYIDQKEKFQREITKLKEENELLKKRLELWEPSKDGDIKKSWGC